MDLTLLTFNYWIGAAREDLASLPAYRVASVRADIIARATSCIRLALRAANAMGCTARKALCFRVLNWLRAAEAVSQPLALAA